MRTIVIENERFLIRSVTEDDKELFMRVQQENSEIAKAYDENSFRDYFWECNLKSETDVYMIAFLKETDTYVGNCSLQNIVSDAVVIGMDIDKPYQNQGIGTELLGMLIHYISENFPGKRALIKTKSNNMQCQRMIEKAGGMKVGEEPTEFDIVMEKMIPVLEENGLTERVQETRKMMNSLHGICVYIYEFAVKETAE